MMRFFPLIPAKAGIQPKEKWRATRAHVAWQKLGPRFRGDER
jgi:hypothetical protein